MAQDVRHNPWAFDLATQAEGRANKDSWVPVDTFTTTNATNHIDMTAHKLQTGDGPVRMTTSGADLPDGYAVNTDYWVIKVDADNFKVASSWANAMLGTAVAIADDGTGTHTLVRKPVFVEKIFVKYILIEAGAAGGTFEVRQSSAGPTLTGSLTIAANAHDQIVVNDYVDGVYMTAIADGQVLVYHGRH